MAEKVITVRIDGVDGLSQPAKKAGDSMDSVSGRSGKWISSFVDLKAAWDAVAAAATRVWGAVQSSFASFDAYESSLRKMGAQSKITGIPLEELNKLAEEGRKTFGLGSVVANDFATSVGKYASRAGDATQSSKLMAAALDLGAASGLTAAETMEALEQGLRGQDEGFDKLLGKNPSALWREYADANGLAVGKMTDTQKRMAELTAIVDAGGKVAGEYALRLTTAAGKQEMMNNRMENAKVKVGEALVPLRELAYVVMGDLANNTEGATGSLNGMASSLASLINALRPAFGWLVKIVDVLSYSFSSIIQFLSIDIQRFALNSTVSFGRMAEGIGSFVQKAGDVLKVFGVKVVASTGDSIKEWGETTRHVAENSLLGLTLKWNQYTQWVQSEGDRVYKGIAVAATRDFAAVATATDKAGAAADQALGVVVPAASKKAGDAIGEQLGPTVRDLLGVTEQAMKDLAKTATSTLAPKKADDFSEAMHVLTGKVEEAKAQLADLPKPVEKSAEKTRDLARDVGTVARGALDLAQAFGVVDAQAASLLNSVVNIAAALPKALAGDISSIGGLIGGVANIASQIMGGDRERNRLLNENTRNLKRLSEEVSGLSLNVSGEDFESVKSVLAKVVPNLKGGPAGLVTNMQSLFNALQAQGLDFNDLDKIAKSLGVSIRGAGGGIDFAMLPGLLEAMGTLSPTTMGRSFRDQLDLMRDSFAVNNTSNIGQISSLFGLGSRFGTSLLSGIFDASDLAATRSGLGALFERFASGGVAASELGGLTSQQFYDLLLDLIQRTDQALDSGATAPRTSAPPVSSPSETDPLLPVDPTGPAGRAADLLSVFREYTEAAAPWMTRMDTMTAAIAENTGLTVEELRYLNAQVAALGGGAMIDLIDTALAERRRAAETNAGAAVAP